MRRRGGILIVLGIVLGLITFVAALLVLSSGSGGTPAIATTKVVIAQQNIAARVPIQPGALTLADWPSDSLPTAYFTDPAKVAGKLATTQVVVGQVLVPSMVIEKKVEESRKGLGSDASYIIPKGKVLVAFPINQVSGVAGALKEGDTVDLLVSYELPAITGQGPQIPLTAGGAKRQVTQLALQDVEILRVGAWGGGPGDAASKDAQNVTFLVSRQDALVLKFLRETASDIQLVLRAAGDHEIVVTEPVIIDYVDARFNMGGTLGRGR
ncbi:MAG: Flp pilus assembly protein CpaB [Chloroflexi bacterium]|nr:Flp pilus assembly protein CpaB [Chloroflexota bacterium]MBI3732202.1 Flp pilus assembly protein CpaB [Chloroflexota bacterium]